MNEFERTSKDDFQRVWDNINELHEVTNITLKNMEDIYDEDILPLQNFKTSTENDMNKLREEMEEFLSFQENGGQGGADMGQLLAKIVPETYSILATVLSFSLFFE